MADPRLNSIHLSGDRRQDYRHARARLLDARGAQTICAEQAGGDISNTLIGEQPEQAALELDFCLADKENVYPLRVGVNTLGRSGENDVVVTDAFVSRRHCAILVHLHAGCELHDTASKNGTYLNGAKLHGPTRLKSGDQIRVCDRHFTFFAKGQPADPPSQSPTIAE